MSRFQRRCRYPSCGTLTLAGHGYCAAHAAHAKPASSATAEGRRAYDATEARRASKRFYGSTAWRQLRAQILAARRTCEACQRAPSSCVDHKIARRAGGAELDPSNLEALCRRCHNAKTASADGGYGNKQRRKDEGGRMKGKA